MDTLTYKIYKQQRMSEIRECTKTSHLLHLFLIVFFGIGFITWPIAIVYNACVYSVRMWSLRGEMRTLEKHLGKKG